MGIPVIQEIQEECRRLAFAGSGLAADDFKLKQIREKLDTLSSRAPVFGKLRDLVDSLLTASREQTADSLLSLLSLVYAVSITQLEAAPETVPKKMQPVTACSVPYTTWIPSRKLATLLDALTKKGSGRLEIINNAVQNNLFRDLRVVIPAIDALAESYPDIPELLCLKAFPVYGAEIIPLLKERFNPKGAKGDGRKLKLIFERLEKKEGLAWVQMILEDASPEVIKAGIEIYREFPEYKKLIEPYREAKNKDIREHALFVLKKKKGLFI